ncbi:DUF6099 family protein [Streptomyces sp. NPDC049954]|uniref:DUF6099 family protein n=1 Tax=Streptomyces sp. NPDC049954 TaxID=3155779 RepID=UPI00342C2452
MDAVRLIEVTARALARAKDETRIMTESWQAQTLARAIGGRLTAHGPPGPHGETLAFSEAGDGGHDGAPPGPQGVSEGVRAARLTTVADPSAALEALERLLDQAAVALVAVASSAQEGTAYWQCMEMVDATDELRDQVLDLRRIHRGPTGRDGADPMRGSRAGQS